MKQLKLKLNLDIKTPNGRKLNDSIIKVECDNKNIPLSIFWRRRLKDALIDNCVTIIKNKK